MMKVLALTSGKQPKRTYLDIDNMMKEESDLDLDEARASILSVPREEDTYTCNYLCFTVYISA